jgi:hypothetical protein
MIDFLLKQVKKRKINSVDLEYAINPPKLPNDEVWGVINKAIEKSKIDRTTWKGILGETLTSRIIHLKKEGKSVEEAKEIILKDEKIQNLIKLNPYDKLKILDKIEISVHARFAENNTSKKIEEEKFMGGD